MPLFMYIVRKWPPSDNIIVYRNNYLDNLSSSKIWYCDRLLRIAWQNVKYINGNIITFVYLAVSYPGWYWLCFIKNIFSTYFKKTKHPVEDSVSLTANHYNLTSAGSKCQAKKKKKSIEKVRAFFFSWKTSRKSQHLSSRRTGRNPGSVSLCKW